MDPVIESLVADAAAYLQDVDRQRTCSNCDCLVVTHYLGHGRCFGMEVAIVTTPAGSFEVPVRACDCAGIA